MNYKRKKQCKGFSLAEAMLAMVILAAAASSILLPFASGAAVRVEGARRTLAAKLASDLMEEIIAADLDGINIIDYYSTYPDELQGHIKDASGAEFTDSIYSNFSRSVVCEIFEEQPFLIIATVTVKYNYNEDEEDELVSLSRLISQ